MFARLRYRIRHRPVPMLVLIGRSGTLEIVRVGKIPQDPLVMLENERKLEEARQKLSGIK